jgi:hypothetical protein
MACGGLVGPHLLDVGIDLFRPESAEQAGSLRTSPSPDRVVSRRAAINANRIASRFSAARTCIVVAVAAL